MRNKKLILGVPIQGNIQKLLLDVKTAIQGGAESYECVSGNIQFFAMQEELEYLTEVEKSYGITMDGIRKRIAEIREKQLSTNE